MKWKKKKARIRSGKIRGDEDERICSNKDLMCTGFGAPCVNDASSCILTCRRSASPRATGLGTGTEGATGAPPSPVRPWSSSIEPRGRDITANRTSTPRRWIPPKPTPFLLLLLFKREIKTQHIDIPHGTVFDLFPPPQY